MSTKRTRRQLLSTAVRGGAVAGLADLAFLSRLRPVTASEARLDPKIVRLDSSVEPLVRLLETTPRDRLLEEVGARVQRGLNYRDLLAALLLAGVRNIEPRPSVGFKFHGVLVVNSAHLASLASPDEDRWLPIFWALDYFKSAAARDEQEGDWTMAPVDESAVPPAHRAREAFIDAMERWDEPAADAAIAGLVRTAGAHEIFELLCRYGARDFRSIGHKAIFVANSWRTLKCIGWHHAEPVLRSLVYAMLNHHGEPNPAENDLAPDRPGRLNQELVGAIEPSWREGRPDAAAASALMAVMRDGSPEDASRKVVELLNAGTGPESVWDALFAGSGELLVRQPGIVALHAMTTTNALRYAYQTTGSDETRRLLMLQNAAFLPMFREGMKRRGSLADHRIEALEPLAPEQAGAGALDEIFSDLSNDPMIAARKVLAHLNTDGEAGPLIDTARRLVFLKGNNAHDYKFSSAVLEDYTHTSAAWRNRYLAASVFRLRGADDPDNRLVQRIRAVL